MLLGRTDHLAVAVTGLSAFTARGDYPPDLQQIRDLGGALWDRCWHPQGITHQTEALLTTSDLTNRLHPLTVPTVVIHGAPTPSSGPPPPTPSSQPSRTHN